LAFANGQSLTKPYSSSPKRLNLWHSKAAKPYKALQQFPQAVKPLAFAKPHQSITGVPPSGKTFGICKQANHYRRSPKRLNLWHLQTGKALPAFPQAVKPLAFANRQSITGVPPSG
jgi:hypothetical protein